MDRDADLFRISLLHERHDTKSFDCGRPATNDWLHERALANQHRGDTRTYVLLQGSAIAGFYGVTVGSVLRSGLPGPLRRNAPDPVGCVLLAQLGVVLAYHGRGLGRKLVVDAMRQAVTIAEAVGCRLFAVHPSEPALVSYYQRFGFEVTEATPALMAMSMKRVRSTLAGVDASDD